MSQPSLRFSALPVVAGVCLAALLLGGCGLAESVAEKFVDDQDVTIYQRLDRSGTLIRAEDGSDVEVQLATFFAGDTIADDQAITVLGFPMDHTQQPDKSALDRVILKIWVEPEAGDATELGLGIVAHLPGHPDAPLTTGIVPDPAGNDVTTLSNDGAAGWRSIDVTARVVPEWNAGRAVTAFSFRLTTPTDGDAQRDSVLTEGDDGEGSALRAHLVLTFSVDL